MKINKDTIVVVSAIVLLCLLGGGVYWNIQRKEAEKVLAEERRQQEEVRAAATCESISAPENERIAACTNAYDSGRPLKNYATSVNVLSCGIENSSGLTSRWDKDDFVIRAAVCVNCGEKIIGAAAQIVGNLILVRLEFAPHAPNATCDCKQGTDIRLPALPRKEYKLVRVGPSPPEGHTCPLTKEEEVAKAEEKRIKAAWLIENGSAVLDKAQGLEKSGQVSASLELYKRLSDAGSPPALLKLCEIYVTGKGDVGKDLQKASDACFKAEIMHGIKLPEEISRQLRTR
jgi:hypothetical protein